MELEDEWEYEGEDEVFMRKCGVFVKDCVW